MMDWLLPIAAKSFLVAGAALLILRLMRRRSAADRSWIAHLGLGAVLLLPIAAVALPALEVAGPEFLARESAPVTAPAPAPDAQTTKSMEVGAPAATFPAQTGAADAIAVDWTMVAYAVPAALLVLLTLIALGRLIPLKARARVLVEPNWLTALARAQQRMGFKHGTALLTSEELPSPISWGVVRPVILLNSAAAESHEEAEAIIAHELAHVAHLDWAKLLLARVAVALFWFNPFVWVLAREAHQLREEAADDAVLASDIEDTDYARLLVGIARHECRGLLIGAHGVAPARNSLSRRVRRVLDGALARAPGGWRWSSAAAFFAAGMAVPVAALNIVPASSTKALVATQASGKAATAAGVESVGAADDGADPILAEEAADEIEADVTEAVREAQAAAAEGIAEAARGLAEAEHATRSLPAQMRAARGVGVTPAYISAMRAAAPELANASIDDIAGMRVHNVTPQFVRDVKALGFRGIDADEITSAGVHGVDSNYARSIAAAGYGRISLEELVEMKIMGVTRQSIERLKQQGYRNLSAEDVVEAQVTGMPPH